MAKMETYSPIDNDNSNRKIYIYKVLAFVLSSLFYAVMQIFISSFSNYCAVASHSK